MKKSNKLLWLFSSLLIFTFILAACAGDGEPEDDSDDVEDGATGENDEETDSGGDLTLAIGSDVVSLSPQGTNDSPSSNVQVNIYETLVTRGEDQEIQPGLAKDWEEVDDTTWDFYLREGVKFHDGEELTAKVVKKNFDRIMDNDVGSPRATLLESVKSVKAVDKYTVRVNLEYPFSPLLTNLTHVGTGMISPKVIDEDYAQMGNGGDPDAYINQHPVGTGPFEYEDWIPGEKVVLTRNEDYWGDDAKLDSATFKVVDEQSTRIAELEAGDSDVADDIGPDNISRVKGMPNADVLTEQSIAMDYVGFNIEKEPFDDKRVRKAVSMAIDKDEILEGVYNDVGISAKGPIAPAIPSYDESVEGLSYDPEKAKDLLTEAGYEDGFETTIWVNDEEQRLDVAVAVQSQLSEIGIDVEVEEFEWGAYLERTANGEHDMFVLGWSPVPDADYAMYSLFHSSKQGDPGNRTFLDNDKVDEVLDEARRETDPDKRQKLYTEAQELLIELAPMVYMHHDEFLLGVGKNVQDFSIDPTGNYQIKEAYIDE